MCIYLTFRNYLWKMSFFIKGKKRSNHVKNNKLYTHQTGKNVAKKFKDDELTSSESELDDGINADDTENVSEDEQETAQEKRLRLAKIYLQEIEKEENERLEDNENMDANVVSKRLKEDYLKQAGKFRFTLADQYTNADLTNIKLLRCKEHKTALTCLCITSDDKYIFSGSKDGSIVKWLLAERKKVCSLPFRKKNLKASSTPDGHHSSIICMALSDDCKYLAAGDESNDIQIWDPENLKHIHTFKSHRNSVTGLVFRKGTHHLYSCSTDRSVKSWSLDEMAYLETLFGHQDAIMAIDALSKDRVVTAGGIDNSARIWKIAEESQLLFNSNGSVDCVKLLNEDNFITGGDAGEVCIWSSMKKKPLCSIRDSHGRDTINQQPLWIGCVAPLVNTDLMATGSSDGFIRLWKVGDSCRSLSPLFTIAVTGFVNSMSFTSDGKYIIAAIGQEHRRGRWHTIKEAKNGIMIIPFLIK